MSTVKPTLRIFLADDHAVVRAGLKALINHEPGLHVVGEASDGEEALARVPALKPDVVVLDVSMPKLSGVETAVRLRRAYPAARIIGLSVHEDRSYLRELVEAGATGYTLKRSAPDELIRAIRTVAGGGVYVDPAVAGELVRSFVHTTAATGGNATLSDREAAVLRLLAEGHGMRGIAEKLEISTKTVETYKGRAMEKLGLRTRVDIIRYAKEHGWFSR